MTKISRRTLLTSLIATPVAVALGERLPKSGVVGIAEASTSPKLHGQLLGRDYYQIDWPDRFDIMFDKTINVPKSWNITIGTLLYINLPSEDVQGHFWVRHIWEFAGEERKLFLSKFLVTKYPGPFLKVDDFIKYHFGDDLEYVEI
jgi:hypothetical protein